MKKFTTWGNLASAKPKKIIIPANKNYDLKQNIITERSNCLAVGSGRAYGDSAYNDDGIMLDNTGLNKFIEFNCEEGILIAESGVTLEEILTLAVPGGWFLPVTPGTKFVTLAGAVANDVHGKNHHKDGSFGCFVLEFCLVRSTGESLICSREQNQELFYATIGGLGLTGWITWVKISLLAIQNPFIITNAYKFTHIDEYFQLNKLLANSNKYTVAWIDCTAKDKKLGRGIYFTGEHSGFYNAYKSKNKSANIRNGLSVPFVPPISLINKYSLCAFNKLYYNRKITSSPSIQYYDGFFYPLDKINNWNRLYGPNGFYQYQCVIPTHCAEEGIKEILKIISKSGAGSFLVVLKTFGHINSGGLLSFAREGVTLALDFANYGKQTLSLLNNLDKVVMNCKGALYPAKDARMSSDMFELSFPKLEQFIKYIDPNFSSNLWSRVYKKKGTL